MINSRQVAKPPRVSDDRQEAIRSLYLKSLQLVERLHRRLLDVIKDEFDRNGRSDINAIQALLLFNIGNAELTAGELRSRGYYLGSNVSYNLKKLVDLGFINHQRSRIDRRSVRVSLTPKGAGDRRGRRGAVRAPYRLDRAGRRHRPGRVPPDEPGAAAARPLLERHHRLSDVVRPPSGAGPRRRMRGAGDRVRVGSRGISGAITSSCEARVTLPPYSDDLPDADTEGSADGGPGELDHHVVRLAPEVNRASRHGWRIVKEAD